MSTFVSLIAMFAFGCRQESGLDSGETDDFDSEPNDTEPTPPANRAPSAPTVRISPETPTGADALVGQVVNPSLDPDGDAVSYRYAWLRDSAGTSITTLTVPPSATARGQLWTLRVFPSDGTTEGPAGEASVLVQNGEPHVLAATIVPTDPRATDTVTCSPVGFADPDGDDDLSRVEWTIAGLTVGTGSEFSGPYAKGDRVGCRITAFDGFDEGNVVTSEVVVLNSAPVVASATISPGFPLENDVLTCEWQGFEDADEDVDASRVRWYRGATLVGEGPTLSGPHEVGDTVRCEVTPWDGEGEGLKVTVETVIQSCGWNATSIGDNYCACADDMFDWCSNDESSDLYFDCCAFGADAFEITFGEALAYPAKANGQPWDWDGTVPAWLTDAITFLGDNVPDPRVSVTADLAGEVLGLVGEHAPELLASTVPPDPELWLYRDFEQYPSYFDWVDADDDNTYTPEFWVTTDMDFNFGDVSLRAEIWDGDAAVDDEMWIGPELDESFFLVYAGRGEHHFVDDDGLMYVSFEIVPYRY